MIYALGALALVWALVMLSRMVTPRNLMLLATWMLKRDGYSYPEAWLFCQAMISLLFKGKITFERPIEPPPYQVDEYDGDPPPHVDDDDKKGPLA